MEFTIRVFCDFNDGRKHTHIQRCLFHFMQKNIRKLSWAATAKSFASLRMSFISRGIELEIRNKFVKSLIHKFTRKIYIISYYIVSRNIIINFFSNML